MSSSLFVSIIIILISAISGYFISRHTSILPDSKFDTAKGGDPYGVDTEGGNNNAKTVDILIVCIFFFTLFITLYAWYYAVERKKVKYLIASVSDPNINTTKK